MDIKFSDLERVLIAGWRGLHPGCDRFLHPPMAEMARQIQALLEECSGGPFISHGIVSDECRSWLALYKARLEAKA